MEFARHAQAPDRHRFNAPLMSKKPLSERVHHRSGGLMYSSFPTKSNLIPPKTPKIDSLRLQAMKSNVNAYYPDQTDINRWRRSKDLVTPVETKRMTEYIDTYIDRLKSTHQTTENDDTEADSSPKTPRRLNRIFSKSPYYKSRSAPLISIIDSKLPIMKKLREYAEEEGVKLPRFTEPPTNPLYKHV